MKYLRFGLIVFLMICFGSSLDAYTVQTKMVAMRDGIRLATDIYKPVTSKPPWPAILMRTPYKRSSAMDPVIALLVCNFMHFTLVIQNTRGRYESEGLDSLYFSDGWGEQQDGYDTVDWLKSQSWCNGRIGTWGASALGITQYMMVGSAPPDLDCCVVIVAAGNLYEDALFYGGVYRESLVDGWLKGNQSEHLIPFFSDHPMYEPLYDRLNVLTRSKNVNVPILHVGGWHDIFVQGQINAFNAIQHDGDIGARGRQKLIIGPWEHHMDEEACGELIFPNSNALDWMIVMLNWFDYYLKDQDHSISEMPNVQYYLMGDADSPEGPGNRWVKADTWPPDHEIIPLYFHADSLLNLDPPFRNELPDTFIFDPDRPVDTIGGRNLNIAAGSYDQREVEARSDVLVYTTYPLEDSVIVTGPVTVSLYASSDVRDTDFTAKLSDVYPDGRSMLVADGIIRARHRYSSREEDFLVPGEISEFNIDLWSTAIAFAPEHCIRVAISSSNSPRFAVNPNTGEPFRKETGKIIANQKIYHSAQYPSALNLPVVSGLEPTVVQGSSIMPDETRLGQNFPNPFNTTTIIPFTIPSRNHQVRVRIIDILGRSVREWLFTNMIGEIRLVWKGDDQEGRKVPSGMYMIQLIDDNLHLTRKMVVME